MPLSSLPSSIPPRRSAFLDHFLLFQRTMRLFRWRWCFATAPSCFATAQSCFATAPSWFATGNADARRSGRPGGSGRRLRGRGLLRTAAKECSGSRTGDEPLDDLALLARSLDVLVSSPHLFEQPAFDEVDSRAVTGRRGAGLGGGSARGRESRAARATTMAVAAPVLAEPCVLLRLPCLPISSTRASRRRR